MDLNGFSGRDRRVRGGGMQLAPTLYAIFCWVLAFAWPAGAATPPARTTFAITDVTVIDGVYGRRLGHRTVLVSDGRIAAITPARGAEIPDGAVRVQGRGKFLIPG